MRLIVGLGNPGREYAWTPHNLGFLVVEKLVERLDPVGQPPMFEKRLVDYLKRVRREGGPLGYSKLSHSEYWKRSFEGQELILGKPTTFMNASGLAVREFIRTFKLRPEDVIVVFDDVDLPWSFVRIRDHGRSGGHKGVESIIAELQSDKFIRVRVGIRPQYAIRNLSTYVLARLPDHGELKEEAEFGINTAAEAVEKILRDGPMFAMAAYNKKVPLN